MQTQDLESMVVDTEDPTLFGISFYSLFARDKAANEDWAESREKANPCCLIKQRNTESLSSWQRRRWLFMDHILQGRIFLNGYKQETCAGYKPWRSNLRDGKVKRVARPGVVHMTEKNLQRIPRQIVLFEFGLCCAME